MVKKPLSPAQRHAAGKKPFPVRKIGIACRRAANPILAYGTDTIGEGPRLHVNPYDETFVVLIGHARFFVGEDIIEAPAGQRECRSRPPPNPRHPPLPALESRPISNSGQTGFFWPEISSGVNWPQARRGQTAPYPLPISTPAANTSAPPSTTWNAARKNGVSMYRFWIHAIAHSSTKTTAIAMIVAVQKSGIR